MKASELKKQNDTELTKLVSEKREEVRKVRFGTAGSGVRNTRAVRNTRREIAQILTELNARARAGRN